MRWIGGPQEQSGDAQLMESVKHGMEPFVQSMGQGTGAGIEGGHRATQASGQAMSEGARSIGHQARRNKYNKQKMGEQKHLFTK